MAAKEGKQWWDPYETSHRKQFIYRPNTATEIQLFPTRTSFKVYSHSGPGGSTVYTDDFCWKPACKPECIRTGTASGQRRNNPHPSQSFMVWRLPRDTAQSPEYVGFSMKCPPSEAEISKALTAQYRSTYRCDFTGMPQGYEHMNNAGRRFVPKRCRHEVPPSSDTEMRDNYRWPELKPELLHDRHSTDPHVSFCGIVPTVVQRHIQTQLKRPEVTTYDRFCGKRATDVTGVIKSLLPDELQQLHRLLPVQEKDAAEAALSKDTYPCTREKVNKLPAVLKSCSSE